MKKLTNPETETICRTCSKKFTHNTYRKRVFCSVKCLRLTELAHINAGKKLAEWNRKHPTDPEQARKWALARDPSTWPRGEKHPFWKGGWKLNSDGYKLIRIEGKYRPEHRVVMEKFIGRKLERTEHVHHVNKNKTDNRIENLKLFKNSSEHTHYHWATDKRDPKISS